MTAESYEEQIVEHLTDCDGENMSPTARRVMRDPGNYDNCPGDFLRCLSTGWEQELPRRLIEMYQGINYIGIHG